MIITDQSSGFDYEIVSVVDTSAVQAMNNECGSNFEGKVLACDYIVFHDPLSRLDLRKTDKKLLNCDLNVFSNETPDGRTTSLA